MNNPLNAGLRHRKVYRRPTPAAGLLLLAITLLPSTLRFTVASDVAQAASLRSSRSTTIIDSPAPSSPPTAPRPIPADLNPDVAQAASLRSSRPTTIIDSPAPGSLPTALRTLPPDLNLLIHGLQPKYSRL